ncbi:MAG: phosphatase PAP2 family protein [Lachnospiraceae bacterium]|nr:phosphatase PAP2 family protein [Lachnospiraceae bacterium]
MIAFSRIYLYVHFPSDVAASIILGSVISLAAILVSKKCFKFSSGLT